MSGPDVCEHGNPGDRPCAQCVAAAPVAPEPSEAAFNAAAKAYADAGGIGLHRRGLQNVLRAAYAVDGVGAEAGEGEAPEMAAFDRAEFNELLREAVALREWKAAHEAAAFGGSGVAARIDALQPDSIACVVNAYRDAYETEMFTQGGIVTPRERAEQAFRDALKSVLGALSAGGGTEPHDGDVSRLLRLWAKPLRGLLNRPEDALALERAADVIESGGMDSVFRVSRSPTGEETHERT